jgi:hypothetical protein
MVTTRFVHESNFLESSSFSGLRRECDGLWYSGFVLWVDGGRVRVLE